MGCHKQALNVLRGQRRQTAVASKKKWQPWTLCDNTSKRNSCFAPHAVVRFEEVARSCHFEVHVVEQEWGDHGLLLVLMGSQRSLKEFQELCGGWEQAGQPEGRQTGTKQASKMRVNQWLPRKGLAGWKRSWRTLLPHHSLPATSQRDCVASLH